MNKPMDQEVIIERASRGDTHFYAKVEDLLLGRLLKDQPLSGLNVMVKPNLLKPKDLMCVTSPEMILAVARALKKAGACVMVSDSPAFGSAIQVIKGLGILGKLHDIGVEVAGLYHAKKIHLGDGIVVGVSKMALEADLVVNVPRLKAHSQMGITCAVKNLFGTVVGFRKALYHMIYGGNVEHFSRMILGLLDVLPRCVTIVDAVCAMHVTGPTGGEPLELNFIAGSWSPIAIDTAVYEVIGAHPHEIPLWQLAQQKRMSGARIEEIRFPRLGPSDIHEGRNFQLPDRLSPLRFSPVRFVKGRVKSLWRHISRG